MSSAAAFMFDRLLPTADGHDAASRHLLTSSSTFSLLFLNLVASLSLSLSLLRRAPADGADDDDSRTRRSTRGFFHRLPYS